MEDVALVDAMISGTRNKNMRNKMNSFKERVPKIIKMRAVN